MRSTKKIKDFTSGQQLSRQEGGSFSHQVSRVSKRSPSSDAAQSSQKYKNIWFDKIEPDAKVAIREVVAQEFFRLLIPRQPKVRLAHDDQSRTHVLSKGVIGYVSLVEIPPHMQVNNIVDGTFSGLGEVLVAALLLNEIDLKFGNMGINSNNEIVKIDGDWCFAQLRDYPDDSKINKDVLNSLPNTGTYSAFNWVDYWREGVSSCASGLAEFPAEFKNSASFQAEINQTLLRSILLTPTVIKEFIRHYTDDVDQRALLTQLMLNRVKQLYNAALALPSFQDFLGSEAAKKHLEEHLNYLSTFKTTGKHQLMTAIPGEIETLRGRFALARTEATQVASQQIEPAALAQLDDINNASSSAPLAEGRAAPAGFFSRVRAGVSWGGAIGVMLGLATVATFIALRAIDVLTFGISLPITIPLSVAVVVGSGVVGRAVEFGLGALTRRRISGTEIIVDAEQRRDHPVSAFTESQVRVASAGLDIAANAVNARTRIVPYPPRAEPPISVTYNDHSNRYNR